MVLRYETMGDISLLWHCLKIAKKNIGFLIRDEIINWTVKRKEPEWKCGARFEFQKKKKEKENLILAYAIFNNSVSSIFIFQ